MQKIITLYRFSSMFLIDFRCFALRVFLGKSSELLVDLRVFKLDGKHMKEKEH